MIILTSIVLSLPIKGSMTRLKGASVQVLWLGQIPAYVLSHVAALLAGLASVSVLPRILGPEQYGTYALIMVTANLAAFLFGEWLVPSGIRLSSDVAQMLIWKTLGWLAVFSSFLGGLVAGALLINQQLSGNVYMWASSFTAAMILSKPIIAYMRASFRRKLIVGYALVSSLGSLFLGISLFMAGKNVAWLISGLSIVPLASFFIYSLKFRWLLERPRWNLVRSLIQFGLPIAITSVGGQILQFADRYMLAIFKTHMDVGIYNVNYNLSDKILGLGFSVLFSSMYPTGSRAWTQGERADVERLLQNIFRLSALFAGAFIWFQAVSGTSLVSLLAGEAFRPPSLIPVLVALGSWLWFTGILQHQPLEWDKRTLLVTGMTLFAASLNIALNWYLIPVLGMIGAATATFASYAAYLAVCTFVTMYYGYRGRVWQPLIVLGTGLGAFLLWYWFEGSASLLQGTLVAAFYLILNFRSLLLIKNLIKN